MSRQSVHRRRAIRRSPVVKVLLFVALTFIMDLLQLVVNLREHDTDVLNGQMNVLRGFGGMRRAIVALRMRAHRLHIRVDDTDFRNDVQIFQVLLNVRMLTVEQYVAKVIYFFQGGKTDVATFFDHDHADTRGSHTTLCCVKESEEKLVVFGLVVIPIYIMFTLH